MSKDTASQLTAEALLAHLRAERAQLVAVLVHIHGPAVWNASEHRVRLAGYNQAIIDAEEWIRDSGKEHFT